MGMTFRHPCGLYQCGQMSVSGGRWRWGWRELESGSIFVGDRWYVGPIEYWYDVWTGAWV